MNNEIFNNKWIKAGIIAIGVVSVIGVIIYAVKKKNEKRKLADLIDPVQKGTVTNINTVKDPVKQNSGIGLISSYNTGSFTVNNKVYNLEKTGIVKLQKYFSGKDPDSEKLISASGGYDGVIGKAFITCLDKILKKMPAVSTLSEACLKSLFTLAKLDLSEFKISS